MGTIRLPDSAEKLAFRAVCNVFRTDPVLKAAAVTVRDLRDDDTDIVGPTIDQMPYIALAPSIQSGGWFSEQQQQLAIVVDFQAWTAGTNADDLLNLVGAIRGALWPQPVNDDATRRNAVIAMLSAVALPTGQLSYSGFEPVVAGEDRALTARGAIKLTQYVNT